MTYRFSLRWLFVGIVAVAVVLTGLLNANPYAKAAIVLPTYLALAYAAIEWAVRRKPWSIGFAIGGWSYILSAQFWYEFPTTRVSEVIFRQLADNNAYHARSSVVESLWALVFAALGMVVGLYLDRLKTASSDG